MRPHEFSLMAAMLCVPLYAMAQSDLVIMRNGSEMAAKVISVDDKLLTYKENDKKNSREMFINLREVYMIRFKERGNIYINNEGKRITGENEKWEKDATRIYLTSGREIQAYNVLVLDDRVLYTESKKKKNIVTYTLRLPEVFFIRYKDGTKDIITNLATTITEQTEPAQEEATAESDDEEKQELQVVFHNVKRGETLATISKRYNVKASDIIEWNDLPKALRPNARLQADMQLMIYVEPAKQ